MTRILPASLLLASAALAYACSEKEDKPTNVEPPPEPGGNVEPPPTEDAAAPAQEVGPPPGSEDPTGNPILLGPPRQVRTFTPAGGEPHFVDGPQWSKAKDALYVSLPFAANAAGGRGILTIFKADGTNYLEVRAGDKIKTGVVGNSIDHEGNLISAELKSVTRTTPTGVVTTIADSYTPAAPTDLPVPFDGPNDLVSLDDGTIYVTDPGYNMNPRPPIGHLIKISAPDQVGVRNVSAAASYDDNPSPNGIALSKDQKTLYVGFTAPGFGTLPHIRKYTINADRSLTDAGKFIETPADSEPDGLAVDENDNLFVALKTGIAVYKPDGEPYGGPNAAVPQTHIDGIVTAVTFGGTDRKSLFVTTQNGKALELKVKFPGISQ